MSHFATSASFQVPRKGIITDETQYQFTTGAAFSDVIAHSRILSESHLSTAR